jgi:predicted nucleic acid-binding protein
MIFVDANVFLRALTEPSTAKDEEWRRQATELFQGIVAGNILATTSEVVLHEVSFSLTSRKQYGMPAVDVIRLLRSIISMPGMTFPGLEEEVYRRALDLWELHPKLEFSDAVIAARCERNDLELASFDRHFDRFPGLGRWIPAEPDIETPPSQES